MYDFTHRISDSIEGITHSICTLEFVNNRELYDWTLNTLDVYHPQQIEFARLSITNTVLSKRKLIQLVVVAASGWDDPRMPTIKGMRRRGVPPEALRDFCSRIMAKADSTVDYSLMEFCIREELNATTPRVMGVVDPIRVVIENYPEGQSEDIVMPYHPEDAPFGSRVAPFSVYSTLSVMISVKTHQRNSSASLPVLKYVCVMPTTSLAPMQKMMTTETLLNYVVPMTQNLKVVLLQMAAVCVVHFTGFLPNMQCPQKYAL